MKDRLWVGILGALAIACEFVLVLKGLSSPKDLSNVCLAVFTVIFAWKQTPPGVSSEQQIQALARIVASILAETLGQGQLAPSSRSPPPLPAAVPLAVDSALEPTAPAAEAPAQPSVISAGAGKALGLLLLLLTLTNF